MFCYIGQVPSWKQKEFFSSRNIILLKIVAECNKNGTQLRKKYEDSITFLTPGIKEEFPFYSKEWFLNSPLNWAVLAPANGGESAIVQLLVGKTELLNSERQSSLGSGFKRAQICYLILQR